VAESWLQDFLIEHLKVEEGGFTRMKSRGGLDLYGEVIGSE
jgi:hypothetical protein